MAINLLGNSNLNNSNINGTISAQDVSDLMKTEAQLNTKLLEAIRGMAPGQVIEGKILSTQGDSLRLLLNNNTVLNTTVMSDANLVSGRVMSFEIQGNSSDTITLRPLHLNTENEATAVKALESAHINVNDETLKMVDGLMKEGMPINKETLQSINKDMSMFPNTGVDNIILAHKLGLEVNNENLSSIDMYRNNNQWMIQNIDDYANEISDVIREAASQNDGDFEEFIDGLKDIFKNYATKDESGKVVINGEEADKNNAFFDKLKTLSPERLKQPSVIKHINSELTRILSDKFLMKPENVADKEYIKNFYKETLETAGRMEELLVNSNKEDSAISKSMNNLKTNVEFINNINELYNYVQLPLKMADGKANGDLYVYKRNKGKSLQDDGPLTALLHLSMETLGNMDIFLKLEDGKLSTRFCLEKEEMIDFIGQHIDELNRRLEGKGYKVNTTVQKLDEDGGRNVIDTISSQIGQITMLSSQSFDARA